MSNVSHMRLPSSDSIKFDAFLKYIQHLKIGDRKTIRELLEDWPSLSISQLVQFIHAVNNTLKRTEFKKLNQSCYGLREKKNNRAKTSTVTKSKTTIKPEELEVLIQISESTVARALNSLQEQINQLNELKHQFEYVKRELKKRK